MGVRKGTSGNVRQPPAPSWTRRASSSSRKATTTCRSGRSPRRSNTARPPSTATSPARTTSSWRWRKKASGCSFAVGRVAPGRRSACAATRLHPRRLPAALRVQQEAPRVLRADVPGPLRAADQPDWERFGFVREMRSRSRTCIQQAIDAGDFPAGQQPRRRLPRPDGRHPRRRAMRLCDRLAPGEDADALARDTLDAALTGLRAGFTHSFRPSVRHCH